MRRLEPEEIECRVAQVSAKGCSLLLYKTARVDRAILDETFGNRWQNDLTNGIIGLANIFDPDCVVLSGSMAQFVDTKKIEDEVKYPGQIKLNLIRETRTVDYAK